MSDSDRDLPQYNGQTQQQRVQAIEEQAGRWFIRLHSDTCTESDIVDHKAWLDANLMHQRAYRELQSLWNLVGNYADRPEVRVAQRCARQIPAQSVTELQPRKKLQPRKRLQPQQPMAQAKAASGKQSKSKCWRPFAVAASLALAVLGSTMSFAPVELQRFWHEDSFRSAYGSNIYQTHIGEQKTVTLHDGSVLVLDTQTRVKTDFSRGLRRIELQQGQAHFEVAHDKTRPFVVEAGNGTITALGTAFVVRKSEDDVRVTLIEGKVAVAQDRRLPKLLIGEPQDVSAGVGKEDTGEARISEYNPPANTKKLAGGTSVTMEAGQQLSYSKLGISEAGDFNVDQVTAWQQGRLIFEDHSLAEVIEDLNRYSSTKIVLGDKSLTSIRITGVFKPGDNHKTIRALETYFSMRVSTDSHGNLVLLPQEYFEG